MNGQPISNPYFKLCSPTQVSCHRPCTNNYRENRKTHPRLPCHGEIHNLGYWNSLFVLCCQPCHSEINSIDYRTSLFVSCHQPCHSEINSVDYSTSLFVSCHRSCCSTGYDQRRKTTRRRELYRLRRDHETLEQREERPCCSLAAHVTKQLA